MQVAKAWLKDVKDLLQIKLIENKTILKELIRVYE
jgi:hypothetical protein